MIPTHSKREASASPIESNGFAPHVPSSATNEFTPNPLRSASNEPFTQELCNLRIESGFTVPLPGSRGLSNLGNTCFMNSALQCLSHTMPLTLYFLLGRWEKDLNPLNPLGSENGELAKAYCALIEKLWNPKEMSQSFSPRDFKYKMGIFNSLFKGYSQQDSQELLQSLLDALHEDLNRIIKKPYIEIPDMDHLSQEEMAAQSWECYSKRNDSIIVDLFQGQYKSRVECLVCGKWSLKFDPYMFLSLPIPGASMSLFTVTVLPPVQLVSNLNISLSCSQKVSLVLNKEGSVESLINALAVKLNWDMKLPCQPVVFEVFDSKIYKIFNLSDPISFFNKGDMICVFSPESGEPALKILEWQASNSLDLLFSKLNMELGDVFSPYEDSVRIPVYFSHSETYAARSFGSLFGLPSALCLPKKLTIRLPGNDVDSWNEDQVANECSRILGLYVYRHLLLNMIKYFKALFPSKTQPSALDFMEFLKENDVPWNTFHDVLRIHLVEGSDSQDVDYFYSKDFMSPYNGSQKLIYPLDVVDTEVSVTENGDSFSSCTIGTSDALDSKTFDDTNINSAGKDYRFFSFDASGLKLFVVEWKSEKALNFFDKDGLSKSVSYDFQKSVFAVIIFNNKKPSEHPSNKSLIAEYETEKRNTKKITLENCITEYSREETLGEEDTWYCPKCKDHRRIKKKIDIWSVPNILVFHLKRFSNTGRFSLGGDKIDAFVDSPLEGLDLSGVVKGPPKNKDDTLIYDLYAISNHYGGLGGGHCELICLIILDTAYAKNPLDKEWYSLDDSYASKTNESSIMTSAAYLLFYSRRNSEIDDAKMKNVIASFTPRILTEVYPPVPGNLNSISNLDVSHSSSSSGDTVRTVPVPVTPHSDHNAAPPPPYYGPVAYQSSKLSKEEDPSCLSDNDRISNSSLENYDGDRDQEMSNEKNKNLEPLWYHGNNIDS